MRFTVTKTYGHDLGLSAVFRQWRADHSHCQYLHGYALAFTFEFSCKQLDDRGWVVDFGALKPIKEWLQATFDHRLLVAQDDPLRQILLTLSEVGLAQPVILERVGCEAFAALALERAQHYVLPQGRGVRVLRVTCSEHGANSATAHSGGA